MKKQQPLVLSLPQPCSESWDKMIPQEQGRFCEHCKRCVVDFKGFSDKELYQYFTAHAGERICGRVHTAQLNRTISIPHQPNSLLYKLAIAAGLVLIITATTAGKTFAQPPLTELSPFQQIAPAEDTGKVENSRDTFTIHGTVYDETQAPLIGAVVELSDNQGNIIGGAITDIDGKYSIASIQRIVNCSLKVKYTSYKTSITTGITISNAEKQIVVNNDMVLSQQEVLSGIIQYYHPNLYDNRNTRPMDKTFSSDEIERGAY